MKWTQICDGITHGQAAIECLPATPPQKQRAQRSKQSHFSWVCRVGHCRFNLGHLGSNTDTRLQWEQLVNSDYFENVTA
jgi:hypothetical protein